MLMKIKQAWSSAVSTADRLALKIIDTYHAAKLWALNASRGLRNYLHSNAQQKLGLFGIPTVPNIGLSVVTFLIANVLPIAIVVVGAWAWLFFWHDPHVTRAARAAEEIACKTAMSEAIKQADASNAKRAADAVKAQAENDAAWDKTFKEVASRNAALEALMKKQKDSPSWNRAMTDNIRAQAQAIARGR